LTLERKKVTISIGDLESKAAKLIIVKRDKKLRRRKKR